MTLTRCLIRPIRVELVRSVLDFRLTLPVGRRFFNHGFGLLVGRPDHTRPLFNAVTGILGTLPVVIFRLESDKKKWYNIKFTLFLVQSSYNLLASQ